MALEGIDFARSFLRLNGLLVPTQYAEKPGAHVDGLCEFWVDFKRTQYFMETAGKVPLIYKDGCSESQMSVGELIVELDGFLGGCFCLRHGLNRIHSAGANAYCVVAR